MHASTHSQIQTHTGVVNEVFARLSVGLHNCPCVHGCLSSQVCSSVWEWTEESVAHVMMTCQPDILTRTWPPIIIFQSAKLRGMDLFLSEHIIVSEKKPQYSLQISLIFGEMPNSNFSRQAGELIGAHRWRQQCCSGHCLVTKVAFDSFCRGNSNCLTWHVCFPHKSSKDGIPNAESKVLKLLVCMLGLCTLVLQ